MVTFIVAHAWKGPFRKNFIFYFCSFWPISLSWTLWEHMEYFVAGGICYFEMSSNHRAFQYGSYFWNVTSFFSYFFSAAFAVQVSNYALLDVTTRLWKEFSGAQNIPPSHCPEAYHCCSCVVSDMMREFVKCIEIIACILCAVHSFSHWQWCWFVHILVL